MKYSEAHDSFMITHSDLKSISAGLKYTMKQARIIAGVGTGKREMTMGLQPIDHLEHILLQTAAVIGIDYGTEWGNELDLTDA